MFAVIETGGKQYVVSPGQKIKVEKITAEEGAAALFDRVLLVAESDGEEVKIGTPYLEGAGVEARVLKQGRAKKIKMLRYKSKTGRRRRKGHRQFFTEVEIVAIK
jgi:large subunit ribosomal protein L21